MASIRQVKAARALLGWSQGDLAERSGVSKPTVARLETGEGDLGGYADTRDKILSALKTAGVIFIEQNGEGPGVRLRKSDSEL
jgi:transcriptional regulator with XRE-family HTH domain